MARSKNGSNRLEEAIALLINNQATFNNNLATLNATQAAYQANMVALQAEIRDLERSTNEKFAQIMAILARHEQILQALPDTIRQKIGFAEKSR